MSILILIVPMVLLFSLFAVPMYLGHRENMAKIKMGIDPDAYQEDDEAAQ